MNIDAFIGLISGTALALLFYGPWQTFCTDVFRQFAFEQRDKLFDFAASGGGDFNSDAYKAARLRIEAMIRFAHRGTFNRVMFVWKFCPDLSKLNKSAPLGDPFDKTIRRVTVAMATTMLFRSAPFMALLICAIPLIFILFIYILVVKKSLRVIEAWAKRGARGITQTDVVNTFIRRAEIESSCV